jgi:hypothetical protein
MRDLLAHKKNIYSQNGEDGVLEELFRKIGTSSRACCEFGAWDGIHFSNTRRWVLEGWRGIFIEPDPARFAELRRNYAGNPRVLCLNESVDGAGRRLSEIARRAGARDVVENLDLLSVDIDGLDDEILESLEVTPRVICIEVNAGHSPDSKARLPRDVAAGNVGQPLQIFVDLAAAKGYSLAAYTGNAIFARRELLGEGLGAREAYEAFLSRLSTVEKEWLYLVNLGVVPPRRRFENRHLAREQLGIGRGRAAWLRAWKGLRYGGK